jgi:hypothetical protein
VVCMYQPVHHPSLDLFYFLLLPLTCCTPCACTFFGMPNANQSFYPVVFTQHR